VYLPLNAKYTYEQARLFAGLIAELARAKNPKIISLERSPRKRQHSVYIDVPQNKRGATTVAAYSLRPRPGAPVSTPLKWEEVKAGLDPLTFNIKTVAKRFQKMGDLWKPVLGPGINLKACLARIEKTKRPQ
jgi:bifunctional non-homologous end joining protein LigD